MRAAWFVAAAVLFASVAARADEAHDLATEIAAQEFPNTVLNSSLPSIRDQLVADIVRKTGRTRTDVSSTIDTLIKPRIDGLNARVREIYTTIYAKDYDLADLRALVIFYRTPLGRRLLISEPVVAKDSSGPLSTLFHDFFVQLIHDNSQILHQKGVPL